MPAPVLTAMTEQQLALLTRVLESDFVPHLPPLLNTTKPAAEQAKKNLSRALSAFALSRLCNIPSATAAATVIDDFEDSGIDAIYFHAPTSTLYAVQGKLKAGQQFQQAEAQKFVAGIRKLVQPDLNGFNDHVARRAAEITAAVESCDHIQAVVTYVGERISEHGKADIDRLICDQEADERRFRSPLVDYGPARIVADLTASRSHPQIDTSLTLMKSRQVGEPRTTYFGLVWLRDLVALYDTYGEGLFDRNIRNHLGDKTPVNAAIRSSLADRPGEFFYLNNGVTALASVIDPKNTSPGGGTRLNLREFSVINGAQTIATAANAANSTPSVDITLAKVALTIIKADADGEFGKGVTRARNHQNPVPVAGFAALDDTQEGIRRELEMLGLRYRYKSEAITDTDPDIVRFEEVVTALALLSPNPRIVWKLQERVDDLRTFGQPGYTSLFEPPPTAFRVVNSVLVSRFVLGFMREAISNAAGTEREGYRHGFFAHAWVLVKRARNAIDGARLLDRLLIEREMGGAADELRETLREQLEVLSELGTRPWAAFRNQATSLLVLESLLMVHYGIPEDAAVASKRAVRPVKVVRGRKVPLYDYPEPLFTYLTDNAPQIGNLT